MKKIFKSFLVLMSLTMFCSLMPVLQSTAGAQETFTNPSPHFTLTVPNWNKAVSRNPKSVLRKALDPDEITSFDVWVDDLPDGKSFKDLPKDSYRLS